MDLNDLITGLVVFLLATNSNYRFAQMRRRIRDHIGRNKDWLSAFVGDRGVGKSRSAFRIGWLLDAAFTHARMLLNMVDYKRLMADVRRDPDLLPPGSVIVIDEAILLAFAHDWAKGDSKSLVKFINTFRFRGWITIFNIPHWGSLQKEIRKHFMQMIEVVDQGNDDRVLLHVFDRGRLRQFSKKPPAMHFRGAMPMPNAHRWKDPHAEHELALYEQRKEQLDGGLDEFLGLAPEDAWTNGLDDDIIAIADLMLEASLVTART